MSAAVTATASQIPATDPATPRAASPMPRVSLQMRAVITIFAADPGFFDLVSPFVNYVENSIDWERIYGLGLSSGHRCVVDFAFICWRDEVPEGAKPLPSKYLRAENEAIP